jgi:hypothetical protein
MRNKPDSIEINATALKLIDLFPSKGLESAHKVTGFSYNDGCWKITAECNEAGARCNDVVWVDPVGYWEFPANSRQKIKARIQHDFFDFDKYPHLGFSCPVCEATSHAREHGKYLIYGSAKNQSRGEELTRQILEDVFGTTFPNIRPEWLVNPDTGRLLELDCYSEEMNLAFEYQGLQHYEPVDFFGGTEAYDSQVKRDKIKRQLCKTRGVTLVEIDSRNFSQYLETGVLRQRILERLDAIGYSQN